MAKTNGKHDRQQLLLADLFQRPSAAYDAGRPSRFRRKRKGLQPYESGADYNYKSQTAFYHIMGQARDMDRNDVIVGTMLDRACTNIIQSGFMLEPQTGSPELNARITERWLAWSENPQAVDIAGQFTFPDYERLALRSTYVDGDMLVLPILSGQLQPVEAHRLRTPTGQQTQPIIHGIEIDDQRRHVRYWITQDDLTPWQGVGRGTRFQQRPAYFEDGSPAAFFIADPLRFSQTRGISLFAPVMDILGMWDDVNYAKLVQAQVVSAFAILETQSDLSVGTAGEQAQTGEQVRETYDSTGAAEIYESIRPGMRYKAAPGGDLKGFSPNVPNEEFFAHVKLLISLAGARFSLPWVMLMLDAGETNFSGWRGAVDQARQEFRRMQRWMIRRLHDPVYYWKLEQWLLEDPQLARLAGAADVNPRKHVWTTPGWPYIQPLADAQADSLRQQNRLASPRRLQAERGRDYVDMAREIVEDNQLQISLAIEAAEEINSRPGGPYVDWRELLAPSPSKPAEPDPDPESGDTSNEQA